MLTFEQFALTWLIIGFILGCLVTGWVKPWVDRNFIIRWPWK